MRNEKFEFVCGVIVILAFGIFIGLIFGGYLKNSEMKRILISKNIAHYDTKTSEFIEDSLVFHGDTIIVIKKDK